MKLLFIWGVSDVILVQLCVLKLLLGNFKVWFKPKFGFIFLPVKLSVIGLCFLDYMMNAFHFNSQKELFLLCCFCSAFKKELSEFY